MSNSDLFSSKAAARFDENTKITKTDFKLFHNRTHFKLKTAQRFFDELKKLNQKVGTLVSSDISRFDVELNLDAFLYEVVGAIDPLLQEINIVFQLGSKPWEVSMDTVLDKLPNTSLTRKTLSKYNGDTQGWFHLLREYRNHSAHRSIIGFDITVDAIEPEPKVYLRKYPRDPKSGKADEEVIEYCQNSLKRMEELIEELYGLCAAEL